MPLSKEELQFLQNVAHREGFPMGVPNSKAEIPMTEGDLLYGNGGDRLRYVMESGTQNTFQIFHFRPFSELAPTKESLPRIVDIYHDALRNPDLLKTDLHSDLTKYKQVLQSYKTFVGNETDITKLCLRGLDFFAALYHIHFIVDTFNPDQNIITAQEINHILKHYPRFQHHVRFYRQTGMLWQPIAMQEVADLVRQEHDLGIELRRPEKTALDQPVYLASANKVKTAAVAQALHHQFPDRQSNVYSIAPSIYIPEQTVSVEETVFQTTNRLLSLRQELETAQQPYSALISIGSGIEEYQGHFRDFALILAMNREGALSLTRSASYPFPDQFVTMAREAGFDQMTVGRTIAQYFGQPDQFDDPYALLTGGHYSRVSVLKTAVQKSLRQIFL